ncbi:hypothetical protein DFA_02867 [Cavenderia fasciculata]|uniref:Ankyrin repeat-containing protein n=1 Tax=Cavenderia fasciculata TaxID=261658 RepID=F4PIP4_CACFS|nr:uncharacterized protein DFA_02867 [Cavenderia fasciculata]EGG24623.1 hypothetical protein DFA_02867 [Cavenderia fasciculata]|eukprot:XP_004362474.1 hypothetical protein DFA_02867 [Cavenderia fasciculata]
MYNNQQISNNNNTNNNYNNVYNKVFKNQYLIRKILRLVQLNCYKEQLESFRYRELDSLDWVLKHGHEGLLKMIFDRGEFEQMFESGGGDLIKLFFTKVKDRQLLLSIYNQYPLYFCSDRTIEYACQRGDLEIVKMVVEQIQPNMPINETCFESATQSNSLPLAKYMCQVLPATLRSSVPPITIRTSNHQMIHYVLELGDLQDHLISLDPLLEDRVLFDWVVANHQNKCVWAYKESKVIEKIVKELQLAVSDIRNELECKQYLVSSKIPFQSIYNATLEIDNRKIKRPTTSFKEVDLVLLSIGLLLEDPIYYAIKILMSWGHSESATTSLLQYYIKTDHPFLPNFLAQYPNNDPLITINASQFDLIYHQMRNENLDFIVSDAETFKYIFDHSYFNSTFSQRLKEQCYSRLLSDAINKCNFGLVQCITERVKTQLEFTFHLGENGASVQDHIDMANILAKNGFYAKEFSIVAMKSMSHPIEHVTDYVLQCQSRMQADKAGHLFFYANEDYLLRTWLAKGNVIDLDLILDNQELANHIVKYKQETLKSMISPGGEIHLQFRDKISFTFKSLLDTIREACLYRDMDLFKWLLNTIRQLGIVDTNFHIAETVSTCGGVENIKVVMNQFKIDKQQLANMQREACLEGSKLNLEYLIEHTELDAKGIARITPTKQSNYLLNYSSTSKNHGDKQEYRVVKTAVREGYFVVVSYLSSIGRLFSNQQCTKTFLAESAYSQTMKVYINSLPT